MKHIIKPLILCIIAVSAFFTIQHFKSQELVLETKEQVKEVNPGTEKSIEEDKNEVTNSGLYNDAIESLEHTVSVAKDLVGYTKTGESDYKSGFDAIRGTDASGDEEMALQTQAKELLNLVTRVSEEVKTNSSEEVILEQVTLVHIADGDTVTIITEDGYEYRVRLIGIDTPESVNPDEAKNNEFGLLASDHTKELLKDTDTIYLEYDKEKTDQYGRILAYVWLCEDTTELTNMLNARILAEGYAVDKVYEPNDKYASQFEILKLSAKEKKNGLWAYDEFAGLMGE